MGLEYIRKLKKEKNITTKTISELSGVPKSTIDKILTGNNTNPKLDTIRAIAEVLGCTMEDFVSEDSVDHPTSNVETAPTTNKSKEYDSDCTYHIIEKISELKKEKGWTNQDLARESGVPFGTIGKLTAGIAKNPTFDSLKRISDALGCTIDDLIGNNDSDDTKEQESPYYVSPGVEQMAQDIYDNPELRILFDASKKLSKDDILAVVDIVKRMKGYEE